MNLDNMQPYVIHRLLNQRARLKAKSPELTLRPIELPEWQPDSDAYDTELDDDKQVEQDRLAAADKVAMDKGIGLSVYKNICDQIAAPQQSSIMYNLANSKVTIPERHLGASNLTGLMAALMTNTQLTKLDLSDNHLGYDGGRELMTVLVANYHVAELNLCRNGFGGNGISAFIAKMMRNNAIITHLNLSDNGFTDEDAKYLASGIEANEALVHLDLSHNQLCEDGATYMGKAIAVNDTIEDLDLSWNSIRRRGAVTICKAIKRNFTLRKLNLAWNGLYYEGALAVCDALSTNKHLIELDISNNRINWEGAPFLAEMLEKNCYLEVLRAGHNPLTTTGCLDIIDAISRNDNSGLRLLDLTEVPVIKDFVIMYKRLQLSEDRETRTEVIHGEIVPQHDILGLRTERKIHPMQKIINYIYEKELRPLELLKMFDKDGKFIITQDEFLEKLRIKGIDIKSWEEKELLGYVCGGSYGEDKGLINYKKLVDSITTQIDNERNHRMAARDHTISMQQLHRRILQAPLPPLDIDAALVQITGAKSSADGDDPQQVAASCMHDALHDRRANSFHSKMALSKNIRLIDPNFHKTPPLSQFNQPNSSSPPFPRTSTSFSDRPTSKVIMSSPLGAVKARKTRSARTRRSKLAATQPHRASVA